MFQIHRGGWRKEKEEEGEDRVDEEEGKVGADMGGGLARVTCFKSLVSLFNGVLGGKPGQGNVTLRLCTGCNYPRQSCFIGLQYK